MADGVVYTWRGAINDDEIVELVESHGGHAVRGWWDQIGPHSLGWVTARDSAGVLVGFVNVAWDGGDHAFLIDTTRSCDTVSQGRRSGVVAQRPGSSVP